MSPLRLYLLLRFVAAFLFSFIVTVNLIYHVVVVQMSPLQLVLIGTILEASVLLLEVPTGIVADLKSRKLSIVIGYAIMGLGFVIEGCFPSFIAIALAQVVWGGGYTFTSGATEAWLADEIGSSKAGKAFLRGAQFDRFGALFAIPLSILVGASDPARPVVIGGVLLAALALFLTFSMREHGFTPTASEDRTTWRTFTATVGRAVSLGRRRPNLLPLFAAALFVGLSSEGFDRLWTPHLLNGFEPPLAGQLSAVIWLGAIRGVAILLTIAATSVALRTVDTERGQSLRTATIIGTGITVLATAAFAIVGRLELAILCFLGAESVRHTLHPLRTIWVNLQIDDSRVRATVLSASGLMDSTGQVVGGPAVGVLGNISIRLALMASAMLLAPAMVFYRFVKSDESVSPGHRSNATR